MLFNIALVAGGIAKAIVKSLQADSAKIKALASDEAQKLATSLATIGQLLVGGEIDRDEAEALIDVQKAASETVLASLEGVGRAAANKASRAGLSTAVEVVDGAIGLPLLSTLLGQGSDTPAGVG